MPKRKQEGIRQKNTKKDRGKTSYENDSFSRKIYAEEICQEIEKNHDKSNSSFVFGISGYWGEGKTYLLRLLERELKKYNYEVIWFSPWKFADDKVSLMRRFINKLNNTLPTIKDYLKNYQKIEHPKLNDLWPFNKIKLNLDDFKYDQNNFKVNPWSIFVLIIIIGLFLLLYKTKIFIDIYTNYKTPIILVLIPIISAILIKTGTLQRSTKSITAVDQFDERLKKLLTRLKRINKKLVIFVDDLDRTTPDRAKEVLDALRTFFDKKEITYVVTGDHKTLEEYVGKKLTDNEEEIRDEGRRFLKKIFNIYWQLPLPMDHQIEKFIKNKIGTLKMSEEHLAKFTVWLKEYFELNPRNIKRFIRIVKFNIESIERRKKELNDGESKSEKDELRQINEVLKNKILLIRALMFQEMAYPFYEKLAKNTNLIKQLEEKIYYDKDYKSELSKIIGTKGKKGNLSPKQVNFINSFLLEDPKFFMKGGTSVMIKPFFRFSAEVGLIDDRGITSSQFKRFIEEDDIKKITYWLKFLADKEDKLEDLIIGFQEIIDDELTLSDKKNYIKTLLVALGKVPKSIYPFLSELIESIHEFIKGLNNEERMDVVNNIFDLIEQLNVKESNEITDSLIFINIGDVDFIKEPIGPNTSICLAKWFINSLDQNIWNSLNRFSELLHIFKDKKEVRNIRNILSQKEDSIIEAFKDGNEAEMTKAIDYLEFTNDGIKKWRKEISDNFDSLSEDQQNKIVGIVNKIYGNKTWKETRAKKWLKNGK